MRTPFLQAAILRARNVIFAACIFGVLACAQEVIGVYNGAATPFGTAAGQTGGFSGSFKPSMPLYHIGGRGEAGGKHNSERCRARQRDQYLGGVASMSVRTPAGKAPRSIRRLLVLVFCGCLFGGGAQPKDRACTPSRIARDEAERLLAVVPAALDAELAGGRVALVRWYPGPSYRAETFTSTSCCLRPPPRPPSITG